MDKDSLLAWVGRNRISFLFLVSVVVAVFAVALGLGISDETTAKIVGGFLGFVSGIVFIVSLFMAYKSCDSLQYKQYETAKESLEKVTNNMVQEGLSNNRLGGKYAELYGGLSNPFYMS